MQIIQKVVVPLSRGASRMFCPLLLICFLNIHTALAKQEGITISFNNLTIKEVFKELNAQTGLKFIYSPLDIDESRKISGVFNNATLEKVLSHILANAKATYVIKDNTIIIKKAPIEKTVTGKVLDERSVALPAVTVKAMPSGMATMTDMNGNFSLKISGEDTQLLFSLLGFESQTIAITDKTNYEIRLKVSAESLDEVIVVGYGVQNKTTLTGSVSQIQGKELTKSPSPNVANSLEGKLPGLIVNQRSGEPGRDDPSIFIRGTATDKDASPLIVIDGVPRSGISRLNPADIETVSVLKDASAAIYGARAANGVILVTTKKGKKGKPVFDFTYNYALQSPTKLPDMLDAATFAQAFNEGDFYDKGRPETNYTPFYSAEAIQKYADGSDPILYPNTNWVDEVLKDRSVQQRYNLQVTGGSDNVRYLLSFGSQNQDGNFKNNPTKYKQYNFRTRLDADISKFLNVSANISGNLNNRVYPSSGTGINFINILQANPTLVAVYPNGLIAGGRLGENPLLLNQRGEDKIKDYPLFSTFTATMKIPQVEGLKLDASFNFDLQNTFESVFALPYYYYEYNVNTKEYDKTQGTATSTISLNDIYSKNTTILYNFRVSYDRRFGHHHVGGMLGAEQQKTDYQTFNASRKNFISSAIPQLNVGSSAAADKDNGGFGSSGAYNNFLGRFNYDFASKYLFEFVFRYDGSPIFPEGKRYGFFPGFSAGWRLSEEDFIKDNFKFIDQLKLRASYGQSGNDRVGSYNYLQGFGFGQNYVFGSSDASAIYALTVPNPNITWERSKKTDFGLEAEMWNGLLGLDLTYFRERRSNLLEKRNVSVSHVFGYSDLPYENFGIIDNKGYEFILSHRNKRNKLTYDLQASLSYQRSNVVFIDEAPQQQPYQGLTGHPVGAGSYYKADGIFHTKAELDAYPHASGTQVGDIKVLDLSGDGIIDGNDTYTFDYNNIPKYVYGLNINVGYKQFDLNIFAQGQAGAYSYDGTFAALGGTDFANAAVMRAADRWSPSNTTGSMPRSRMYQPGNTTFFLYDNSFVRLKSVELGYTLPAQWIAKAKLSSVRLFLSGYNLLTWAKEVKWADPEMDYNNGGFNNYPPLRVVNFGASIRF